VQIAGNPAANLAGNPAANLAGNLAGNLGLSNFADCAVRAL